MSKISIPRKSQLQKRLKEEQIGELYADDQHGARIVDGRVDLWFSVPAEKAGKLLVGDLVVIYDFYRSMWLGGRVNGMDNRKVGTTDRDRMLYDKQEVPLLDRLIKGHTYSALGSQLFQVEPLAAFKEGRRTIPNFIPSAASVLLMPTLENTWSEPTINDILDLPSSGIMLGVVSQNERLYVKDGTYMRYLFSFETLTNKHIVILGSTGSGKTICLKQLAWEIAEANRAVVTFDLQGDIIQMAEQGTRPRDDEGKEIWKNFSWKIGAFPKERFKIFAPISAIRGVYDRRELELVEDYAEEKGIDFTEFSLEFRNIRSANQLAMYMPHLTERAKDGLGGLFTLFPKMYLKHFLDAIERGKAIGRGGYPTWVVKTEQVTMHSASYENMMGQLRALLNLGIFDIKGKEEPSLKELVQPGQISVIYLSHLPENLKARYMLHVPYRIMSEREEVSKTYIIIDEAHEAIPRKGKTDYVALVSDIFANVARQGRKYDIDLIVSTHKPRDLNPIVYDLAGTVIAFRLSKEDAQVVGIPSEFRPRAANFNPGFALINSPENSRVPWIEIKVPWIRCAHEKPKDFRSRLREASTKK